SLCMHSAMVRTPSNRVEGGKKLGEIVPQNSQKRTLYQRVRNISGATTEGWGSSWSRKLT
ncbi:MAG: hypothetical protein P3W95_011795, partial [Tepidimonas taiwanensis]|nr:hypothetical protein [Tepidimonas taiwanensis]